MKKIRVLQVNIDNNGGNGAFSLVRNLYPSLKNEFIFDYFTMDHFIKNKDYYDIVNNDGKCFSANLRKNRYTGHIKLPFIFYKILKFYNYRIVHIHSEVAYKQALYCISAKLSGVDKIIVHSHSSNIDGDKKIFKYLMHIFTKGIVNFLATDYLSCSTKSSEWMFLKRNIKNNKVKIIDNGIIPYKYKFSLNKRERIRKELGISNKLVIGHVGALKRVKNQTRLLKIIKKSDEDNIILILIGDGEDKEKLIRLVDELNLSGKVKFLGARDDIDNLLQGMDVFVFPSLFEGVPLSLLEAQATGLPILMSDAINENIIVNNNVFQKSLDDSDKSWFDKIKKIKDGHIEEKGYYNIDSSKYNIEKTANILKKVYYDEHD